jgi:hypothetical protein
VHSLLDVHDMKVASALLFVSLAACTSDDVSSSTSLTRLPGECGEVEVHVIGVSEVDPGDGGGGPSEDGSTVVLTRPGRHILVLSSYRENVWNVQVQGEAKLDGIYAVGYEPQTVTANVRTQINTESKMEGGAGANGYIYPDVKTEALLTLSSIRTALHPTSFHGCFSASRWTIGEDMTVTSDCGTGTNESYQQYNVVLDCDGDNTCGSDQDGDGDTGDGWTDGALY